MGSQNPSPTRPNAENGIFVTASDKVTIGNEFNTPIAHFIICEEAGTVVFENKYNGEIGVFYSAAGQKHPIACTKILAASTTTRESTAASTTVTNMWWQSCGSSLDKAQP